MNALAGHFNSFGLTAPVPKKRLDRIQKVTCGQCILSTCHVRSSRSRTEQAIHKEVWFSMYCMLQEITDADRALKRGR